VFLEVKFVGVEDVVFGVEGFSFEKLRVFKGRGSAGHV